MSLTFRKCWIYILSGTIVELKVAITKFHIFILHLLNLELIYNKFLSFNLY